MAVPAFAALLLSWLLADCSLRQVVIGGIADELAAQGKTAETDLDLARDASAFYLKHSESVLQRNPGQPLAESLSAGFTQYAYACFLRRRADRIHGCQGG
jgi:hypothetical protein